MGMIHYIDVVAGLPERGQRAKKAKKKTKKPKKK